MPVILPSVVVVAVGATVVNSDADGADCSAFAIVNFHETS